MTTDAVYGFDADYQIKMHMRSPAITYQYLFAYISDNTTLPEYMGTSLQYVSNHDATRESYLKTSQFTIQNY